MKRVILGISIMMLFGCSTPQDVSYTTMDSKEAYAMMQKQDHEVIIDVRTAEEFSSGHIPQAMNLPLDQIEDVETKIPDKDTMIFVYCRSGNRSAKASKKFVSMGYTNVVDFGGIQDWPYDIE